MNTHNIQLLQNVKAAIKVVPEVQPYLTGAARYVAAMLTPFDETKTADAMYRQIWNRVLELYRGEIDEGAFVDALAEIVQFQLTKAFREALRDNELDPAQVAEEPYGGALEEMVLNEFDFVDGLATDILEARKNESGFEQFQSRAEIWGNRYNDAYNQCAELIAKEEGNNLVWVYGDTEHCDTCLALNGIVAKVETWEELGIHPQQPPNDALVCGGWRCQCRLEPTDKRQSPKAYESILNAVTK